MVEVYHGHIDGGQVEGTQQTEPPENGKGGGHHPVFRPVLGRPEEISDDSGGQVAQRNALQKNAHPALAEAVTEAVRPLGVHHHGKGGVQPVHDILL